jgi:predicted O-linked N-acetylglucosamine transferase (SPINDLY family)
MCRSAGGALMSSTNPAQHADASRLDAACAEAMNLQLAGQLDLAGQLYRAILTAAPGHAAANHCAGMLQVQLQRPADGLPLLLAALEASPEVSDYWLGYLEALSLAGRIGEATSTLAFAREHGLVGRTVEDFAMRLRAKGPPAAVSEQEESALLKTLQQGNLVDALAQACSMTKRFPEQGLGWKVLGALLSPEGESEAAMAAMHRAIRLMPDDADVHANLGLTLTKLKRFEEAESYLRRALAIDPEYGAAHYRLFMTYELQGRFADAEASLRRGLALSSRRAAGEDELSFSNLLFLMSHNAAVDADALFAEHCRYGEYVEKRVKASWPRHRNSRRPARRLKIGFASGDLYNHAVSSFIEPVLLQLGNHPGLELHAYYNNVREDEVSGRLRRYFKTWTGTFLSSDVQLARAIRDEQIDILIDLAGHTGHNRLPVFARKPAPVQASWIGYPGTTGLRSMDYYLAGRQFLPPGEFDRHFTEKLIYLPANVPFRPHPTAPPVNRLPALDTGRLTFGSFNRLSKINDATIGLWSHLLRELPTATMLIAGIPPDVQHTSLIERFSVRGIAAERLILHPRTDMDAYLALHHQVDLCLDTTPYTGGTTTTHALWMGVPTLTVAGPTPAARSGAAFLGDVELFGFIATDAADFAAKGVYWATRLAELSAVRAGLRERWQKMPTGRSELIGDAFAFALRRMWKRWCQGLPAQSFEITASDLKN